MLVAKSMNAMNVGSGNGHFRAVILLLLMLLLDMQATASYAADSLCARVKIEIKQELTLERQAFDANMVINNGLEGVTLEAVQVDVVFTDENGISVRATSDPNDTDAEFFIRIDSMEGIDSVDGAGMVAPLTSADIHWLIIPAAGTGGSLPSGKLYYVGATLTYFIGSEEYLIEVSPDYIFVKPMPMLTLDYFLPEDVYGDDAFTQEIEPPIPFTLGVRVNNTGDGVARNLKIESAQPRIVENEQGLLVDFKIIGSTVDDQPDTPSLLIDFGDIDAHTGKMGRWSMTSTLSGEFVEFTAEFTHADELGGELTSLLEATTTHTLLGDVLVDLPGRDGVRDFLAQDALIRVFESNATDTTVTDVSGGASLGSGSQAGSVVTYNLTVTPTGGFLYAKVPDPQAGSREVVHTVRSDGKILPLDNVWTSKKRREDNGWDYFINLFDVNSPGAYTLSLDIPVIQESAPVLQFIPDRTAPETTQVSFIVEASDPNGQTTILTATQLPAGAVFADQGNGTAIFDWTPPVGSADTYPIVFRASDGTLGTAQLAQIIVVDPAEYDSDEDGLSDQWELENFGNLDRDGSGDFDGDGISDLDEFLNGTDPLGLDGPSIPVIVSPAPESVMGAGIVQLEVENSTHPHPGQVLSYDFEVYGDAALTDLLESATGISEGSLTTVWSVSVTLPEDRQIHWRARAFDGTLASHWVYGDFYSNSTNDPATPPKTSWPLDGVVVGTPAPVLEVTNGYDTDTTDGQAISYAFELATDSGFTNIVATSAPLAILPEGRTFWTVPAVLADGSSYHWRVKYPEVAPDGTIIEQTALASGFSVNLNNAVPPIPVLNMPDDSSTVVSQDVDLLVDGVALDTDGESVSYLFEIDISPTFDSPSLQASGPVVVVGGIATWTPLPLADDTRHYWRAKSTDGQLESQWMYASFSVNTVNESPAAPTAFNPGMAAWSATLTPTLYLGGASDDDDGMQSYEFELYSDAALSSLLVSGISETGYWTVGEGVISDHSWSYWRARALDNQGALGAWASATSHYVNDDMVNAVPEISLTGPATALVDELLVTLSWSDFDDDNNASVSLYYDTDSLGADGTLIVAGLSEDEDGSGDTYSWNTALLGQGTYYFYAVISDGEYTVVSYAPGSLVVTQDPLDSDEDGIADSADNCPTTSNPGQQDSGGLSTTTPDGVGDACQCGDASNNGIVDNTDAILIKRYVLGLPPGITVDKCNVNAGSTCDNTDAILIQRAVLGLPPGISQSCAAAGL